MGKKDKELLAEKIQECGVLQTKFDKLKASSKQAAEAYQVQLAREQNTIKELQSSQGADLEALRSENAEAKAELASLQSGLVALRDAEAEKVKALANVEEQKTKLK